MARATISSMWMKRPATRKIRPSAQTINTMTRIAQIMSNTIPAPVGANRSDRQGAARACPGPARALCRYRRLEPSLHLVPRLAIRPDRVEIEPEFFAENRRDDVLVGHRFTLVVRVVRGTAGGVVARFVAGWGD